MESKRVMLLVTMMMVMAMGSLVIETEAVNQTYPFGACYPNCLLFTCPAKKGLPKALLCPFSCLGYCINHPDSTMSLANANTHNDYYCNLGCATQHCAPLSSIETPNVDKVVNCVDSCSNKCSTKN